MKETVDDLLKKTFIKLRSDYGFKRSFGKDSKPYKSKRYDEMFDASEIASMAAEDIVAYKNSIMLEMERRSELEFKREEGIEEGIKIGREEGIISVAKQMKKGGMETADIMLFTGLSESQILSL